MTETERAYREATHLLEVVRSRLESAHGHTVVLLDRLNTSKGTSPTTLEQIERLYRCTEATIKEVRRGR